MASCGAMTSLAFGRFCFYNHSYRPNARYLKRVEGRIIEMVALRDIEAGEEILTNYNGDPEDETPVWFEVTD